MLNLFPLETNGINFFRNMFFVQYTLNLVQKNPFEKPLKLTRPNYYSNTPLCTTLYIYHSYVLLSLFCLSSPQPFKFLLFLYSINFVFIRKPHQDCLHYECNHIIINVHIIDLSFLKRNLDRFTVYMKKRSNYGNA